MESCLQPLWDLLYDDMSSIMNGYSSLEADLDEKVIYERCSAVKKTRNIIKQYFTNLEDNLNRVNKIIEIPEHIRLFDKALETYGDTSTEGIRNGAKQAKAKIEECKLCAACKGCANKFYDSVYERNIVEKGLPKELEGYFGSMPQMFYYQKSMQNKRKRMSQDNTLLLLKGFSSSTPMIYSAAFDRECVGGGFYLNYKGIGIVIDPGMGFVSSMHKNGIYIEDIDVVIITHDHLDHNADAEKISSLVHDLNIHKSKENRVVRSVFKLESPAQHEITWIGDAGTRAKLKKKIPKMRILKDFVNTKGKQIIKGEKRIKLSAIRTKHIKNSEETYGIRITMEYDDKCLSVGYTSDTAYFDELSFFFNKQDILIFNVSDLYRKDVRGIKDKSGHLGYNGSIKLLKRVDFNIGIASEFCCTNGDFRLDFINSIKKETNDSLDRCILPGEIGLSISLPDSSIECSICKRKTEKQNIRILTAQQQYGKISYVCGHCAMNVVK